MITVKSPGKLMLAGEWSILEAGNSCIVIAVNKFVEAKISASNTIIFDLPSIGFKNITGVWDGNNFKVKYKDTEDFVSKFKFCFFATQVTLKFLQEQNNVISNFKILIKSDLSKVTQSGFIKLGLGSSAATTTSVCKAILAFHGYDVNSILHQDVVFKLSCIAHFLASEKIGSCFDVAAAAFAHTLIYKRFDPIFLENFIKKDLLISDIIFTKWPGLYIEKLQLPKNLQLIAGFCGSSSSTTNMIHKMYEFKLKNGNAYKYISDKINMIVLELILAIKNNQMNNILKLINKNQELLQELAFISGITLETSKLKYMLDQAKSCGMIGKISGAGGGDCIIAVSFDKSLAQNLANLWNESFFIKTTDLAKQ